MKYLLFASLCLLSLETVFSLECLSTDLRQLRLDRIKETVQECHKNLRDVLSIRGSTVDTDLPNAILRCYTVTVYGERTIDVKGCVVNGGCSVMKETFKSLGRGRMTVDCFECEGDRCNSNSV